MSDGQTNGKMLNQMLGGCWITQGIYVAAELGIADELADGPQPVDKLAKRTGADGESLYRLLRALASFGIFAEEGDRRFSLTPLAERLRSDVEGSQRCFAIMMGSEFYRTWGELLHSVRTGEAGFTKAYGKPFFEYMLEHPDRHGIYDEAMSGIHGAETRPVLDAYDFSGFERVIDIGGGNGSALTEILRRYPEAKGVLFDLPDVVERARMQIGQNGLSDRCESVGGDFFTSVPEADLYVMRHVIHDWQDEDAVRILGNCRKAMRPGGRVLVVESVIPPLNEPSFGKWLDLMMLLVNGRERTEEQFRGLFEGAGLRLSRVVPTSADVSVIEGVC